MTRVATRAAALLLAAVGVGQCSSSTSPTTSLPTTRLRSDSASFSLFSGYTAPATLTIRNTADLAAAWGVIYGNVSAPPAIPSVDFTQQMIVGVALGTQANSGTDVLITGARESHGSITVDATVTTTSGSSCVFIPVIESPVDLALIPAVQGDVQVSITRKTKSC